MKIALGKHKEQYKYQGDLKAIMSFIQWLFKDSEYLEFLISSQKSKDISRNIRHFSDTCPTVAHFSTELEQHEKKKAS